METLTLQKAARIAELCSSTLRTYIERGDLKATKKPNGYYAVERADLDAFLAKPRRPAGNPNMGKKAMPAPVKVPTKGPAHLAGEMIIPPGVKFTSISTPPPRFQSIDLPTVKTSATSRAGAEDFRQHQRKGRF